MKVVMILWPLHNEQITMIFIEVKKITVLHESGDDLVSHEQVHSHQMTNEKYLYWGQEMKVLHESGDDLVSHEQVCSHPSKEGEGSGGLCKKYWL